MQKLILTLASCILLQLANSQEILILDSAGFSVAWVNSGNFKIEESISGSTSEILSCFLVQNGQRNDQAVLGTYIWKSDSLIFQSIAKPSANSNFECRLRVTLENLNSSIQFNTPGKKKVYESPKVVAVYPTSNKIPLNILFFYIDFNQPMNPDYFDYKEVKLIESNGKVKQQVWRHEVNWNMDKSVAAVMIHPGRVKRGIDYMENHSEVFVENEEVTLVVGSAFKSADGKLNKGTFVKKYSITARDTTIPQVKLGVKQIPKKETNSPIIISFTESMCYGSILEGFQIIDPNGNSVKGKIESNEKETLWKFVPNQNWKAGEYKIEFNEYPADLCQNTIYRSFEIANEDEGNYADKKVIPFSIK